MTTSAGANVHSFTVEECETKLKNKPMVVASHPSWPGVVAYGKDSADAVRALLALIEHERAKQLRAAKPRPQTFTGRGFVTSEFKVFTVLSTASR